MKRAIILSALALAATFGSSIGSVAEARGWRGHGFHRHVFIRPVVPIYPVYSVCRWYRTPYGLVRRCW